MYCKICKLFKVNTADRFLLRYMSMDHWGEHWCGKSLHDSQVENIYGLNAHNSSCVESLEQIINCSLLKKKKSIAFSQCPITKLKLTQTPTKAWFSMCWVWGMSDRPAEIVNVFLTEKCLQMVLLFYNNHIVRDNSCALNLISIIGQYWLFADLSVWAFIMKDQWNNKSKGKTPFKPEYWRCIACPPEGTLQVHCWWLWYTTQQPDNLQ